MSAPFKTGPLARDMLSRTLIFRIYFAGVTVPVMIVAEVYYDCK